MELFGPDFERYKPEFEEKTQPSTAKDTPAPVDKAKKGKLLAKATGHTYQFQIMESIGIPRSEIKKFADALHWTKYFPPIAKVLYCLSRFLFEYNLTSFRQIIMRLALA
jgi:leucyl-tRNA synthetase